MMECKMGERVKGLWGDPAIRRDKLRDEGAKKLSKERPSDERK